MTEQLSLAVLSAVLLAVLLAVVLSVESVELSFAELTVFVE